MPTQSCSGASTFSRTVVRSLHAHVHRLQGHLAADRPLSLIGGGRQRTTRSALFFDVTTSGWPVGARYKIGSLLIEAYRRPKSADAVDYGAWRGVKRWESAYLCVLRAVPPI